MSCGRLLGYGVQDFLLLLFLGKLEVFSPESKLLAMARFYICLFQSLTHNVTTRDVPFQTKAAQILPFLTHLISCSCLWLNSQLLWTRPCHSFLKIIVQNFVYVDISTSLSRVTQSRQF